MPLRHRRPLWAARIGRFTLLGVAFAVAAGSSPAAAPASHGKATTPTDAHVTGGWTRTADRQGSHRTGVLVREDPIDGPVVAATRSDPTTPLREVIGPTAILDPLAVEQGDLTLRWHETDGLRVGIAAHEVLVERAAATQTGCAAFTRSEGFSLSDGRYDEGTLSLGAAPSSGCLRVSLALTDRAGRTSLTSSRPYRVQPPAPVETVKPAPPRWSGRFNLFRANAFVTQKTFKWCVAASVQMMVNLVRHRTDRSRATQARMIAYAQRWDNGPYGEEGGTDVTGWIAALRHYGAGRYRAVGTTSPAQALRVAATAMRQTGRPAGILVMDGRHAWVLHGFESKTDPRRDRWANVTAVRVSGPLYPVQQTNGYDPRPNSRMSALKLSSYFTPTAVGTMVGKYVVVIPTH